MKELQNSWTVKNRNFAKEAYLLHKCLQAAASRNDIYKHKVALLSLGWGEVSVSSGICVTIALKEVWNYLLLVEESLGKCDEIFGTSVALASDVIHCYNFKSE